MVGCAVFGFQLGPNVRVELEKKWASFSNAALSGGLLSDVFSRSRFFPDLAGLDEGQ